MKLVACSLLLVGLVACGDDGGSGQPDAAIDAPTGTPDAAPRQTVMEGKDILSNQLVEGTLAGGPGDVAVITLMAPQPQLDWNLHGHAGGSTQVVKEELGVMSVSYTFSPTAQADWFLLLRNKHTATMTVQVKLELYGNITWSGW